MRIGIVACEILKREIEMITGNDPEVVHREYLEWGLHDHPDRLNRTVVEKVNAIEGKVDVVFLGYAICRSLGDMPSAFKVPTIMLREEDCIGSMLGQAEYSNERSVCPGTWFSPPGWSALGMDGIVKDDQIEGLKELGYDKLYFAKAQLSGYSRCLFIDTGVGDKERYESLTMDLAKQLDLRCECREADLRSLKDAWQKVKSCTPSKNGPGH